MLLRDLKELFISKEVNQFVLLFYHNFKEGEINKKTYDVLNDFYEDDLCDDYFVDHFSVHYNFIFISVKKINQEKS